MKQWLLTLSILLLISTALIAQSADDSAGDGADSSNNAQASADAEQTSDSRPLEMYEFLDESRTPRFRVNLPTRLLEERNQANTASARMSFTFSENNDSPLSVEFDGQVTEIPLAAASFDRALCDTELDYDVYREREHTVQIGFQVRTRPVSKYPISVTIEHWHMRAENENVFIAAYTPSEIPPFASHSVLLPNALPGLNRYIIRLPGLDSVAPVASGQIVKDVSNRGASHFITVHEVAALGLLSDASFDPQPSVKRLGAQEVYRAGLRVSHEFTLSPAIDPSGASIRLLQRGEREVNAERVSPSMRELLGEPRDTVGAFRTLKAAALIDLDDPLLRIESLGEQRYRLSFVHALAMSSELLPMREAWDYRIEIWHEDYASSIDRFDFAMAAQIRDPLNAKISFQHSDAIRIEEAFTPIGFTPAEAAPPVEDEKEDSGQPANSSGNTATEEE